MNSAPLQSNCWRCKRRFVYQPIDGQTVIHPRNCSDCDGLLWISGKLLANDARQNEKGNKVKTCKHNWDENYGYSGFQFRKCRKCGRLEGWGFDNKWSLVAQGKPAKSKGNK